MTFRPRLRATTMIPCRPPTEETPPTIQFHLFLRIVYESITCLESRKMEQYTERSWILCGSTNMDGCLQRRCTLYNAYQTI